MNIFAWIREKLTGAAPVGAAAAMTETVSAPAPATNSLYPYVVRLRFPGYPIIKMKVKSATEASAKDEALAAFIRNAQITATIYDK